MCNEEARWQGEDDGTALICDGDAILHTRHRCVENATEIHIASRNGILQDLAIGEAGKDGHYEGLYVYGLDLLVAMEKAGYKVTRIRKEGGNAQSETEDESGEAEESGEATE